MNTPNPNPSYSELSEYFKLKYQLTIGSFIIKGHLNLPILRCEDAQGIKLVVKVGINHDGENEVLGNMSGYQSMISLGAQKLVPNYLRRIETLWGPAILMQDLGDDYVTATKSQKDAEHNAKVLKLTLQEVCATSLRKQGGVAKSGILEFKSQLMSWVSKLNTAGFINDSTLRSLESFDVTQAVSEWSTIMILDFTPDNVFIAKQGAVFIDPWKQVTYEGTMIPSIAQFCTVGRHVYEMPGGHSFDTLLSLCQEIGEQQRLNHSQIEMQMKLGAALQYSLSAYVRIMTNPELASEFSSRASIIIDDIG